LHTFILFQVFIRHRNVSFDTSPIISNPRNFSQNARRGIGVSETTMTKRELEKLRQHRSCAITLAHQVALRTIKHGLCAQGLKVSDFTHRELRLQAEAYFQEHRAELIAEVALAHQ
jgi:hypothetical protein